jgi:hypothetical protein
MFVHFDDLGRWHDRHVGWELTGVRSDDRLRPDQDHLVFGMCTSVIDGARNDFTRAVISTNGIDGNSNTAR